jgi:hypothetical protein
MAQVPNAAGRQARRYHSGLYEWLTAREELAATKPCFPLLNADGPGYGGYRGMPDRLATLRAGCALNLPVCDLPKHARIGLDNNWWNRVIVEPDGTITLAEEDALLWAAENGV